MWKVVTLYREFKLCRYLQHLGYEVTYVRNFTDVDDKVRIINIEIFSGCMSLFSNIYRCWRKTVCICIYAFLFISIHTCVHDSVSFSHRMQFLL